MSGNANLSASQQLSTPNSFSTQKVEKLARRLVSQRAAGAVDPSVAQEFKRSATAGDFLLLSEMLA